MQDNDYLINYYNEYDEEGRLQYNRVGMVEYLTTRRYLDSLLTKDCKIAEIGAGTGRYSVTLAKEGYDVTAVELVPHNLDILRSKLDDAEKITALKEAVRITKPGGHILVAYCMNEATVIQYVFGCNKLREIMDLHMLTDDWKCISEPKDLFEMVRTEDIERINASVPIERVKLVAADGASRYIREYLEEMDEETFEKWLSYHFATCERQDLIGATNHALDILRKV